MTNKDIIFEEKAEIVDQVKFEADQFVTIVKAEKSSQTAKPGQFAFVECGGDTLQKTSFLSALIKRRWNS